MAVSVWAWDVEGLQGVHHKSVPVVVVSHSTTIHGFANEVAECLPRQDLPRLLLGQKRTIGAKALASLVFLSNCVRCFGMPLRKKASFHKKTKTHPPWNVPLDRKRSRLSLVVALLQIEVQQLRRNLSKLSELPTWRTPPFVCSQTVFTCRLLFVSPYCPIKVLLIQWQTLNHANATQAHCSNPCTPWSRTR